MMGMAWPTTHRRHAPRNSHNHRCRPGTCCRDPISHGRALRDSHISITHTSRHPGSRSRCSLGRDDDLKVRSEEHTSELQSLMRISYAVFCLKKKNQKTSTISKLS